MNLGIVYSVTLLGTYSTVPIEIRHWRCEVFRMSLSIFLTTHSRFPTCLSNRFKRRHIDCARVVEIRKHTPITIYRKTV